MSAAPRRTAHPRSRSLLTSLLAVALAVVGLTAAAPAATAEETAAPVVTVETTEVSAVVGETATLTAVVEGADALQWQSLTGVDTSGETPVVVEGTVATDVADATGTEYAPDTTAVGTTYYRLSATGTGGSATSPVVTLTVTEAETSTDSITTDSTTTDETTTDVTAADSSATETGDTASTEQTDEEAASTADEEATDTAQAETTSLLVDTLPAVTTTVDRTSTGTTILAFQVRFRAGTGVSAQWSYVLGNGNAGNATTITTIPPTTGGKQYTSAPDADGYATTTMWMNYALSTWATQHGSVFTVTVTDATTGVVEQSSTTWSLDLDRVTTQPVSRSVAEGTAVSLSAAVTGAPGAQLQWQVSRDGGTSWADAGLTPSEVTTTGSKNTVVTSTVSLTATMADSGSQYRLAATSALGGTFQSDAATLTVLSADGESVPVVQTDPSDVTATSASPTVQLTAEAIANPAPDSVVWQARRSGTDEWTDLPASAATLTSAGGTVYSSTLTVGWDDADTGAWAVSGTEFRAVFSNALGSGTTAVATLTSTDTRITVLSDSAVLGGTIDARVNNIPVGTYYLRLLTASGQYALTSIFSPGGSTTLGSTTAITAEASVTAARVSYLAAQGTSNDPILLLSGQASLTVATSDTAIPIAVSEQFDLVGAQTTAPTITAQPDWAAYSGSGASTFSVTVASDEPYAVYWALSTRGTEYTGVSTSTYYTAGTTDSYSATSSYQPLSNRYRAYVVNSAGIVISDEVGRVSYLATALETDLPATELVGVGGSTTLQATATGSPKATATWSYSADGTTWTPLSDGVATSTEFLSSTQGWRTTSTFTLDDAALADTGQYKVSFTGNGTKESTATALTVSDSSVGATVTTQPVSQSIESGESVTFTAAAVGVPAPTVQWQRSTDDGATWSTLRGATSTSYTVESVDEDMDGWRYRAVFSNAASPDGVATQAATLTVTARENVRTTCGTSYGPTGYDGDEFCFEGPEKLVYGEDIVLHGISGYLSTDDVTGSVVNFFLDALYSGDPATISSKQTFTNPATGKVITDARTSAVVQAAADGSWTVTIPWPTTETVDLTQAEIDELFAVGTTHSVRILTGSLLTSPADRQRGASQFFTIVNSLDDEVEVTEPIYEHFTTDVAAGDDAAVAWIPTSVDSGSSFALTGTGWLTKDQAWGSTVTVRLQDETGAYYQHTGQDDDPYPDPDDPTVWQVVQAGEDGVMDTDVAVPPGAVAGDYLAVELSTTDDGTDLGDVERYWVSESLNIDGTPYVPELSDDATCTAGSASYTYELDPDRTTAAANVGGTIRLTGTSWCNLVGTGSLIAVKIDAGGYSHLNSETAQLYDARTGTWTGDCPAGICETNKTIWAVIQADDTGSFDVEITLPDRTNSKPTFGEGSYTLQLLTRTISADSYYAGTVPDPSRSVQTREFTVVAEGESLDNVTPGEPAAAPDPLHVTQDLTDSATGGVTVDQQDDQWVVTVPGAAAGDWVYVDVYDGSSPRFPWGTQWFQVDANHQVVLPLAGAAIPTGTNKLSVQDRSGALLGWTWVTVAEVVEQTAAASSGAAGTSTVTSSSGVSYYAPTSTTGEPKPGTTPDAPVATYSELDESNVGDLAAVTQDGNLIVTIPSVEGGHWVYLYLYTQDGQVIGVDWVQVGTDHTITIQIGSLPAGTHKLAVLDEDGTLLGWVTATGSEVLAASDDTDSGAAAAGTVEDSTAAAVAAALTSDLTWTLVLVGLALLVLAGSITGVVVLRTPPRARRTGRPTTAANQG
ncbi:MAG TPA: immunoglobulin domain-containing protein [Cellulomonas sp.]